MFCDPILGVFKKKTPPVAAETYTKAEIDALLLSLEMKLVGMRGGRPKKQPDTSLQEDVICDTTQYTVFKNGKIVYKH
jgi:hypothetical protein